MHLFADCALLPGGWRDDVAVEIEADGRIAQVASGATAETGAQRVGLLLPAPVNAHSHTFQRAMAGLAERRGSEGQDSFWTWRALMYRFLDRLIPDDVEAIAALVQVEMLEAGYAACVEFHYLHHQPDGTPYDLLAEMSERIAAAAAQTGIGLTLLPVLYRFGGCDGRPLGPGQWRFGNDLDRYARLVDSAGAAMLDLAPDAGIGVAPHSLRALSPDDLTSVEGLLPDRPIHMHLAEQVAEVSEVEAAYGKRPVELLLDIAAPDPRWCLIHCTQMQAQETERLARTGAVAGLCPITEANLGDGVFDGAAWIGHGGAIAIGSDSNVRIALSEELRLLEYGQRLRDRARAVLAPEGRSTGRWLFDACLAGGGQAAGRGSGAIALGAWADLVALDRGAIALAGRAGDAIVDSWIFAADDRLVTDVWSAGRHVVREGRHRHRDAVQARYREVMARLADAI